MQLNPELRTGPGAKDGIHPEFQAIAALAVGIAQIAPVWLNREETLAKVIFYVNNYSYEIHLLIKYTINKPK